MIKDSVPFPEPQRGKDLLVKTNELFVHNYYTAKYAALLADGLVFVYPVLLVVWYLVGLQPGKAEMKYGALYVAGSAAITTIVNVIIQYMIAKERPEGYIDNAEMLIMDHLPTEPFPSDHAAVSAAVGMATLLWALKAGHTYLTLIGIFLILGAIVMSISRVGVAIHRPTDIIAGFMVGILVAIILHGYIYEDTMIRKIFDGVISIQESIFRCLGLGR